MITGYSQYGEDVKILEFFNNRKGNLLDIGANDGRTISNSLLFIQNGWSGVLIEASHVAFEKLINEHINNKNVYCLNKCLSEKVGKTTFYHNLNHFGKGDTDLLSTIVKSNFEDSSRGFGFSSFEIDCVDFKTLYQDVPIKKFNYISIDIEGMDLIILKQMDLKEMGVELLIIEYNNSNEVKNEIINYCSKFDLNNILIDNGVNIVLYKK